MAQRREGLVARILAGSSVNDLDDILDYAFRNEFVATSSYRQLSVSVNFAQGDENESRFLK